MSQDERQKEEEGIKVKDRRRFTPEGETRAPDEDTGEGTTHSEPVSPERKTAAEGGEAEAGAGKEKRARTETRSAGSALPPMDFATFILSLASTVQIHLGLIANPQTGKPETNLQLAKETIDLLDMLREKTKGNLTNEEERLFEHVLYELRMLYVEKRKQTK